MSNQLPESLVILKQMILQEEAMCTVESLEMPDYIKQQRYGSILQETESNLLVKSPRYSQNKERLAKSFEDKNTEELLHIQSQIRNHMVDCADRLANFYVNLLAVDKACNK